MPEVMIVDDDPQVLRAMGRLVRRLPVRLVLAVSAEEAMAQIERNGPPSLLISDYQLPRMDGLTLLVAVKRAHPQVRAVLSSGTTAMAPPASDITLLPKPVEAVELAQLIASLPVRTG